MLSWQTTGKRARPLIVGTPPPGSEGKATAPLIAEFWRKALDAAESVEGWEILVAYASVETGDVMVYPTTLAGPSASSGGADVMIRLPAWQRAYEALPDAEEAEAKFEAGYRKPFSAIARALRDAIDDPSVLPCFEALKGRPRFGVFCVDAVEEVHRSNLDFLWGHRPPKGIPSGSAKELFEHLLKKGHVHPPTCMTEKGGVVRKVRFFGGDFNDKFVDLLASVPDLASVCRGLEELRLELTRIKPAAVERLRALLPETRVIVQDR
jgi:hypothetical protein